MFVACPFMGVLKYADESADYKNYKNADESADYMRPCISARVAELADAPDLGSGGQPWGFNSPLSHQLYGL